MPNNAAWSNATEAEIADELNDLFRDVFGDDSIILLPQTLAADIEGWDSFNHLTLVIAMEQRFNLKFTTKEIEAVETIYDFIRIIVARRK